MNPLLTVIVPAYEMAGYLAGCCESCLAGGEATGAVEVLVVDDGSHDETAACLEPFLRHPTASFRLLAKPNGHYGSCVNAALACARGAYVRVLDADDRMEPAALGDFLALLRGLLTAGERPDLLLSSFDCRTPEGRVLAGVPMPQGLAGRKIGLGALPPARAYFLRLQMFTYRRALLEACAYRQTPGQPYTDLEWTTLPLRQVRQVRIFEPVLTHYTLGREGQSMEPAQWMARLQVVLDLVLAMVRRAEADLRAAAPEAEAYYRQRLLALLEMCYRKLFFGEQGHRAPCEVAAFDAALRRANPALYAACEAFTLHARFFRFAYVRRWRAAGSTRTWGFRLLGAYLRIRERLPARG